MIFANETDLAGVREVKVEQRDTGTQRERDNTGRPKDKGREVKNHQWVKGGGALPQGATKPGAQSRFWEAVLGCVPRTKSKHLTNCEVPRSILS